MSFLYNHERRPPAFSLPKSVRPGLSKVDRGNRAGPGKPLVAACGKQVESRRGEAPRMVFGKSQRPALLQTSSETGPGEYEYDDGMGNQVGRRPFAGRQTICKQAVMAGSNQ